MANHTYGAFTPARRAALLRAARISAAKRHLIHRGASGASGIVAGVHGAAARNSIPYARVNKRSQTFGNNTGSKIPGTGKRIVTGSYIRIENIKRQTSVDRFVAKGVNKIAPPSSRGGKALGFVNKNVSLNNPALRAKVGGNQVRLGTSRGAGPTVVLRKGKHKTPQVKSKKGVQAYDKRQRTIAGNKAAGIKHRPQRRKAAAAKRRAK